MSAGRICVREVHVAEPDEPITAAARRMLERNVGTLAVLDGDRRPIGFLTDRDVTLRTVAAGRDPSTTRVAEVMTRPPMTVGESEPIESALSLMRSGPFRRVLVIDRDGRLAGLLSVDDVLDLLCEELTDIAGLLSRERPLDAQGS